MFVCRRSMEKRIQELEKDLFYYKKTSRELKHRLRDVSVASSVMESIPNEKHHASRTYSDKSRDSNSSDERRSAKARVASPEAQLGRNQSNENFHLPPVQRIVQQEEKKSKNDARDGTRSPKTQKHDRLISQEEQKRLKVNKKDPILLLLLFKFYSCCKFHSFCQELNHRNGIVWFKPSLN